MNIAASPRHDEDQISGLARPVEPALPVSGLPAILRWDPTSLKPGPAARDVGNQAIPRKELSDRLPRRWPRPRPHLLTASFRNDYCLQHMQILVQPYMTVMLLGTLNDPAAFLRMDATGLNALSRLMAGYSHRRWIDRMANGNMTFRLGDAAAFGVWRPSTAGHSVAPRQPIPSPMSASTAQAEPPPYSATMNQSRFSTAPHAPVRSPIH